jgi:hypothetical protein
MEVRMIKALLSVVVVLCFATVARATPITYQTFLSGLNENPSVTTTGTGFATIIYDPDAHTLSLNVTFSDLIGTTTASHIHCCVLPPTNAIVATTVPTFAGFPLGVTAGTYVNTLDLTLASSFNPAFITAHGGTTAQAEADLAAGLAAGTAYLNIHTTFRPGGEIRGNISAVPEPAALSLLALGLGGLIARRKRQV